MAARGSSVGTDRLRGGEGWCPSLCGAASGVRSLRKAEAVGVNGSSSAPSGAEHPEPHAPSSVRKPAHLRRVLTRLILLRAWVCHFPRALEHVRKARETSVCCSTRSCIHWLTLPRALTTGRTRNLGGWGMIANQLSQRPGSDVSPQSCRKGTRTPATSRSLSLWVRVPPSPGRREASSSLRRAKSTTSPSRWFSRCVFL